MIEEPTLLEAEELNRAARARAHDLRRVIEFGLDVDTFLKGPIGQRIMADTEREVQNLMEQLVKCDTDTEDGRTVARGIRRRIDILDCWQEAFAGYLNEARDAQHQFIEGETTGDEPEFTP